MNTELPHYRPLVESALEYAGWDYTFEDVAEAVEAGEAQFWPGPNSVIITQLDEKPRKKVLVFWLAAGNTTELKAMVPLVIAWGKEEGCALARMVGRRGWKRSFLMEQGWEDTHYVVLEKGI